MSIEQQDLTVFLSKFVDQIADRYRQEMEGIFSQIFDEHIEGFSEIAASATWRECQHWSKWQQNTPILLPDNTRIYYRRGDTEIVLQEFPPQIRLMKFTSNLIYETGSPNSVCSFSLALPYLVFIFKFKNGLFSSVYLAFNDCPLKNLKETVLLPFLPNIDMNLKVCLGKNFDEKMLEKDNIAQQCSYVLSYFWQTIFNNELSDFYWKYWKNESLEKWQQQSAEDPLFVLEGNKWIPYQRGKTFGALISDLLSGDSRDALLKKGLYDKISKLLSQVVLEEMVENSKKPINLLKKSDVPELAKQLEVFLNKTQEV